MATAPLPEENVVIPTPEGSSGSIIDYPVSDNNLNIVADTYRSEILSASRYGSSTLKSIKSSLEYLGVLGDTSSYSLSGNPLNGLANNTNSSGYQVTNVGTSFFVKVSILLWDFEPTALEPKVIISNGTNSYSITVPGGLNKKNIEFLFIPSSFVSSFYVRNETGTSFSTYSNTIKVQGI